MMNLNSFKAYDIRGRIPDEINESLAYDVGRARGRYGIRAPATSGNEQFERVYRVQMNTLENAIVFLPALWLATRPGTRLEHFWILSVASVVLQALLSFWLLHGELRENFFQRRQRHEGP